MRPQPLPRPVVPYELRQLRLQLRDEIRRSLVQLGVEIRVCCIHVGSDGYSSGAEALAHALVALESSLVVCNLAGGDFNMSATEAQDVGP